MTAKLERFLALRPGDLNRGFPLALYYFFIIAAYMLGQNARDALFLGRFPAELLAWGDLIVAVSMGAVLAIYLRLGRVLSLVHLLAVTLMFFAANALLFHWAAGLYRSSSLLVQGFYVWVGIFGIIAIAQVWTLFGYVLTGREGKRLLGFVGSGGILGGIASGIAARFLAGRYGAESLLPSMAACIAAAAILVLTIAARNKGMAQSAPSARKAPSARLLRSLRLILDSSHLRIVAALILIGALTVTIAGWQFKAIMKQVLGNAAAIAQFRGTFDSVTGALALTIQILITPRLLRHWGIRVALVVLPIALFGGSVGILASGGLVAATVLAGAYKSIRNSLDTAGLQLLYMPVAAETRVQVKPFLDTVVQRGGDGVGAIAILVATGAGLKPAQFGWIVLGLLLVWLAIARTAGLRYVSTLGDTLRQHRLNAEALEESPIDRSATQLFVTELKSNDPERIVYALDLLGGRRWKDAYASIRGLLGHPAPAVRAKAISILRLMGDAGNGASVEPLLRDPNIDVRTEALLFMAQLEGIDPLARIERLGDFPDFPVQAGTAVFLARTGDRSNLDAARLILEGMLRDRGSSGVSTRVEAARLIRFVPDGFALYLAQLLEDDDPRVVREAIRSAGARQNPRYVASLIALLSHPELGVNAAEALVHYGEGIQGSLGDHLSDSSTSIEVRREIPDLLVAAAKRGSRDVLLANLRQGDSVLRFRIIAALNRLQHTYPDLTLEGSTVEAVLASEIMSHCASYQVMGRMSGHMEQESFHAPLLKSIDHERERIFRLLKMLHPQHDLQSAFVALQSTGKADRDNALEFIDNTLKIAIRRLLIPLLDGETGVAEKAAFANRMLNSTLDSSDDALQVLMRSEDPWLKSCAAHLIGVLGLKQFQTEVDRWATDPDPLLSEKAQRARERLSAAAR